MILLESFDPSRIQDPRSIGFHGEKCCCGVVIDFLFEMEGTRSGFPIFRSFVVVSSAIYSMLVSEVVYKLENRFKPARLGRNNE